MPEWRKKAEQKLDISRAVLSIARIRIERTYERSRHGGAGCFQQSSPHLAIHGCKTGEYIVKVKSSEGCR